MFLYFFITTVGTVHCPAGLLLLKILPPCVECLHMCVRLYSARAVRRSCSLLRWHDQRSVRVAYYVVLYKRMYKVHKPEHRLSYLSIINTNSYRECVLCLWCVGTYIPSVGINITHFGGTLFGFAYGSVRQRLIIFQKGGNYTSPTLYVFCVKKCLTMMIFFSFFFLTRRFPPPPPP
jgi:hypothetical protein